MNKRIGINKKLRFEIFTRDNFMCKYCGKTPQQGAILQVDHIIPVSKGGQNNEENLVTSCFDCNIGKSAHLLLNPKNVNEGLKKRIEVQGEYLIQLKEYYKLVKKLRYNFPEKEIINQKLNEYFDFTVNDIGFKSFYKLWKQLTADEFIEALEIVKAKNFKDNSAEQTYKYLCGVMSNLVRRKTDPFYNDKWKVYQYYLKNRKWGSDYYLKWKADPLIEKVGVDAAISTIEMVSESHDYYMANYGGFFNGFIVEMELLVNAEQSPST